MFPSNPLRIAVALLAFSLFHNPLYAGTEMITNGDFSTGTEPWTLDRLNGATAVLSVESIEGKKTAVHIEVPKAADAAFHVQLFQGKLSLTSGITYHLSFRARSKSPVGIGVNLMVAESPWSSIWKQDIKLTPEWQDFSFDITPDQSNTNARVTFTCLAAGPGEFWFTDVSLKATDK